MSDANQGRPTTTGVLARLADTMFRNRRKVIATWFAIIGLSVAAMATLGGEYAADYDTPGSGSQAAAERLNAKFGGQSGESVDIVWSAREGARDPAVTGRVDGLLEQAGRVQGVLPGASTRTAEVSPDGRTAIVRLNLDRPAADVPVASGERLAELVERADAGGVRVAANGNLRGLTVAPAMTAELIGVAVAAVVLLVAFGTVVAAGLPLLLALTGVAVAVMLGGVLAAVIDTPDWALQVAIMIGLGVGIDYALLVMTRYRSATRAGRTPREANAEAMSTAGHSVLVAGATVVIALMGLFLMRLPYLNGVALAASLTVLVVMAVTATLLPAVIGATHKRIDRMQLGRLGLPARDLERTPSSRWARAIDRRPVIAAVVTLALLAVLAAPLTGIRFGFPDAGNDAKADTTRQAYDMVAEGFGAGANGPLIAVATTERPGDRAKVEQLRTAVDREPGVVAVSPAQRNEAGDTALVAITPTDGPQSQATKDLVEQLRDGPLARAGLPVSLGGQTAALVDQANVTAARLPLFIGAVVTLAILLLVGAFRAPVIAVKAGVLTALSIVASYGVVALVAEGGWAGQLVGIDSNMPVPPFIPVIMFAVLFGLAMDYEVFLVSRMKEERERLGNARDGVRTGLARTSRVILAAALIMVSVFGAFALSPEVTLKLIGVGLASAILIDAILVRMILVPAVLRLLGELAWWAPGRRGQAPAGRPSTRVTPTA